MLLLLEATVSHDCLCLRASVHFVPLFSLAKSRDASHNKLDSEVVPKVARMTVSGKKQTMGFDVPRYLTPLHSNMHCPHKT